MWEMEDIQEFEDKFYNSGDKSKDGIKFEDGIRFKDGVESNDGDTS